MAGTTRSPPPFISADKKMSILNQSIAPIGQPPVQPSKGTAGTQEAKSSQMSLLKGASVGAHSGTTASGILNIDHLISIKHKPCYSRIRQEEICKTSVTEAEVQQSFFSPNNMAYSFMDDGKMSMMSETQIDTDDNRISSKTSGVLAVSVSSAVELDDRQINLITRKMQRLTGFMNLRLENTVDPSLLAGFVIRYSNDPSQVIDLSVKNQLATVAAQLEHSDQENIAGYSRHNKTSSHIKR